MAQHKNTRWSRQFRWFGNQIFISCFL